MNDEHSPIFDSLWVEKYRPRCLDELIIDDATSTYLRELREKKEIPHLLLHGTQGLGKTSLAKILAYDVLGLTKSDVLYINASEKTGIDVIRSEIMGFAVAKSFDGNLKVVILDEVDGLSAATSGVGKTSAQQALRNVMEECSHNVRFILTTNYLNKVSKPLISRCVDIKFDRPPLKAIVVRLLEIARKEHIIVPEDQKVALAKLAQFAYPDIRKTIQLLQKFCITGTLHISLESLQVKDLEFASELLIRIRSGAALDQLRRTWLENEVRFANDYHDLLRNVFQCVYQCAEIAGPCKRSMLLIISEAMYRHATVMDPEINFFAAMMQLQTACQDD